MREYCRNEEFWLYNPNKKEDNEFEIVKDKGYFVNRLNMFSYHFYDADTFSVKEFYYNLYVSLLDEYKIYLENNSTFENIDKYEAEAEKMRSEIEFNISKKLILQ